MDRRVTLSADAARDALESPPAMDLQANVRERRLADFLVWLQGGPGTLTSIARDRARALAEDHERVRQATGRRFAAWPRVDVEALLPVDIVGVFHLQPKAP
jgi:hypothetical protein